jgi:hypothetical protein
VRILFTFAGGNGHFVPLLPVAGAAATAGHTVAFGCGPSMVPTVEAAHFTGFPLGTGRAGPPQRIPLRPLDAAREDREFRDRFARYAAQERAPRTLALCTEWQPDVLVRDETDFGGMVAAERLGLPYATVLVMAAGSFVRKEVVGEALNELRAIHGLPPGLELEMLRRHLVLSPFPPSFRDPAYPLPTTACSFRALTLAGAGDPAPAWSSMLPGVARPNRCDAGQRACRGFRRVGRSKLSAGRRTHTGRNRGAAGAGARDQAARTARGGSTPVTPHPVGLAGRGINLRTAERGHA